MIRRNSFEMAAHQAEIYYGRYLQKVNKYAKKYGQSNI